MEVRCGKCDRSIRIPDEKISESGIKFKCTKCGATVNVTLEDFQAHKLSSDPSPLSDHDAPADENAAAAFSPRASFTPPGSSSSVDAAPSDTVHPFVSGSLAGAFGGIGCATPLLLLMLLGISAVAAVTAGRAVMVVGTGLIGFSVLVGIVLAFLQARTESTMFGVLGALIGGLLGVVFGVVRGIIVASGSGAVFSAAMIIGSAIGWGIKGLLLTGAVILVRRAIMSPRKESMAASISGGQLLIVGLAILTVFLGMFGEVRSALNMKTVKEATAKTFQNMASAEGLLVANALSSWDPATGDLVLNVTIENQGDTEKKIWYLVATTRDASGAALSTAKMLTGKQIYTQRDYEIMGKRGMDIRNLQIEHMRRKDTPLAAHGTMDVELRILEPPTGIASFDAAFEPFDPLKMIQEQIEEAKKQRAGTDQQQAQ
jgi:predicted Zn finger-like uncharacterized protein